MTTIVINNNRNGLLKLNSMFSIDTRLVTLTVGEDMKTRSYRFDVIFISSRTPFSSLFTTHTQWFRGSTRDAERGLDSKDEDNNK